MSTITDVASHSPPAIPGAGGVVVVGDVYCDIILRDVARLPQWGEEVFGEEPVMCPGGVANIAVGLARLGISVTLLGRARAEDTIGQVVIDELSRQEHLRMRWLHSAPSTALTVALTHGSERAMVSYAAPHQERPAAGQIPWEALDQVGHLHLGGWSEGPSPLEDQAAIVRAARARGWTVSLDVSLEPGRSRAERVGELLSLVDVVIPNAAEACWLAGAHDVDAALEQLARVVPTVVVKLGSGGARACSAGISAREPASCVEVVDTTGAGDAFAAGFLYGYLRRWPLQRSLTLANVCGGLSVGRIGSSIAVPTRHEAFTEFEQRVARPQSAVGSAG